MSEPFNNLLSGYIPPDRRRRIANALMADQFDRPTPHDGPVTERAGLFPLGTYANGQTGIAWPGFVAQPVEAFNRLLQRGYQGGTGDMQGVEDAFDVAGSAMVGGLLSPKPSQALGTFGGKLAKTADTAALARAEEMTARGVPREQVWSDTGWFRGVDGKWRFEIDDSGLRLIENMDGGKGIGLNGSAIQHPLLAAAYPSQTANLDVTLSRGKYGGGFDPDRSAISAVGSSSAEQRSIIGHELQHLLQKNETFAVGADPNSIRMTDFMRAEDFLDNAPEPQGSMLRSIMAKADADGQKTAAMRELAYRMYAGEVEASAVQKRMDMTPAERRARPPWLDYDVPEDQQIVRFGK